MRNETKKKPVKGFFCAEREGFEPPEQLPVHRISSAARSTTPASFHWSFACLRVQNYELIVMWQRIFVKKFCKGQKNSFQGVVMTMRRSNSVVEMTLKRDAE